MLLSLSSEKKDFVATRNSGKPSRAGLALLVMKIIQEPCQFN
jgi:hypothetical protein